MIKCIQNISCEIQIVLWRDSMQEISYNKLWKILIDKKINKSILREELKISPNTIAKMSKNEYVKLETIVKIANYFNVQIGDIVEIIYLDESR